MNVDASREATNEEIGKENPSEIRSIKRDLSRKIVASMKEEDQRLFAQIDGYTLERVRERMEDRVSSMLKNDHTKR